MDRPLRGLNAHATVVRLENAFRQPVGESPPDLSRRAAQRKAKAVIGPPAFIFLSVERVANDSRQIDGGHSFPHPIVSHHGGLMRPDLKVIWQQEDLRYAGAETRLNPVSEVPQGHSPALHRVDQAANAPLELIARQ